MQGALDECCAHPPQPLRRQHPTPPQACTGPRRQRHRQTEHQHPTPKPARVLGDGGSDKQSIPPPSLHGSLETEAQTNRAPTHPPTRPLTCVAVRTHSSSSASFPGTAARRSVSTASQPSTASPSTSTAGGGRNEGLFPFILQGLSLSLRVSKTKPSYTMIEGYSLGQSRGGTRGWSACTAAQHCSASPSTSMRRWWWWGYPQIPSLHE